MKTITTIITAVCLMILTNIKAQELTQTIRGTITDQDSKTAVIGSHIIILGTDPIIGAGTDLDGNFRLDNVPVGRVDLKVSCLGYNDKYISNVLIGSGKEVVLNIEMLESVTSIDAIEITAQKNKAESLNKMATVSAKTFTVEETKRYAGSFNDPARMVSGYAGVTSDPMGNNDIVVRGNSPRGILWKLEGIDIPNPNHFANEGGTGGPINALNSAMLANSDFFSGAFAPEYGNAYSGVFDMKLRRGNNEKREYSLSAGVLGTDLTVEGPFKEGYNGSYLVNYRYSSLAILDNLDLVDFHGVPKYQDACFVIDLPSQNLGKFTMFGLGGYSSMLQTNQNEEGEDVNKYDGIQGLGVLGLNHTYLFCEKTYLTSTLSFTGTQNGYNYEQLDEGVFYLAEKQKFNKSESKIATTINHKLNAKNRFRAGVILTKFNYNMFTKNDIHNTGSFETPLDINGDAEMAQGFASWKYRVNDNITLTTGLHYMHYMLNDNNSVEPRMGLRWKVSPKQTISAGFGIHSKLETISIYQSQALNESGQYYMPNKDLDMAKAAHYVLGYENTLTSNLNFKAEIYYQDLYDLPVENSNESPFAMCNVSDGFTNLELVNKGTGYNYGIEMTLERFYTKNFYFLFTSSLYQSKYTALDGIERNTRYNGKYAGNLLVGKEFNIGAKEKGRTIALNTKLTLMGGQYYTPVDLETSRENGYTIFDKNRELTIKGDDIFSMNLGISYRKNRKHATHEFKIDISNLTNNQATVFEYYNSATDAIEKVPQLALLPNLIYTIQF